MKRLLEARAAARPTRRDPPDLTLEEYVRQAWEHVDPAPLVWEPHMSQVCAHLEAVTRGDLLRLLINIPPGTSKSLLVSTLWPSWVWTKHPARKWIFGSYAATVSRRDALRMRHLIETEWYRERWGDLRQDDTWTAGVFVNRKGGFRVSTSVGGQFTGWHADVQVVDDPLKPQDVLGAATVTRAALDACLEWWKTTMSTRFVDAKRGARVIVMQRLHEDDLAGAMLKTGEYAHLCLPMEYDPARPCRTPFGGDWRTEKGELLAPTRFSAEAVKTLRRDLGPNGAAAQLDQNPVPPGGAIFKAEHLRRYWKALPADLYLIQSWDCRFKEDGASGDYVVGQVWGHKGGEFYLVDQIRERYSFTETVAAMRLLSAKYPRARLKLVENKANGPAVANTLKKAIPGIVLVEPEGGKEARANAVSGLFEAENVLLPEPERAPWVLEYVEEMVKFPRASHDDQVDGTTQALLRLSLKSGGRYTAAMKELANG